MNKSEIAETKLPCGCICDQNDPKGPIFWNPFNKCVQCHKCGQSYFVERAIADSQAPQWISVKEKLPPDGDIVLCYEGGRITTNWVPYPNSVPTHQRGRFSSGHDYITHWMPLPDPPKGNENA